MTCSEAVVQRLQAFGIEHLEAPPAEGQKEIVQASIGEEVFVTRCHLLPSDKHRP